MPDQRPAELTRDRSSSVFLNLPYDDSYGELFLAYIAGLSVFGLTPRMALEISTSARRSDRIHALIQDCGYSIHDLSWIAVDGGSGAPRFNMPFELGMAVAEDIGCSGKHRWYVFEKEPYRLQKSLSDLNGTDAHIHGGTPTGVFAALMNIFVGVEPASSVESMQNIYDRLLRSLPSLLEANGANSVFNRSVFSGLFVIASEWLNVSETDLHRVTVSAMSDAFQKAIGPSILKSKGKNK